MPMILRRPQNNYKKPLSPHITLAVLKWGIPLEGELVEQWTCATEVEHSQAGRRKLESGPSILECSQRTGKPKRTHGRGSVRRLAISLREQDFEYWLRTIWTLQGHSKNPVENTGKETLEVLLQTHFPQSNVINPQDGHLRNPVNLNQRTTRED
jgi:hypothetical protein